MTLAQVVMLADAESRLHAQDGNRPRERGTSADLMRLAAAARP